MDVHLGGEGRREAANLGLPHTHTPSPHSLQPSCQTQSPQHLGPTPWEGACVDL